MINFLKNFWMKFNIFLKLERHIVLQNKVFIRKQPNRKRIQPIKQKAVIKRKKIKQEEKMYTGKMNQLSITPTQF